MNLLAGLAEAVSEVEDFQDRFNGMTQPRRMRALFQFENRLASLFSKYNMTCMCTDCDRVMQGDRRFEQG